MSTIAAQGRPPAFQARMLNHVTLEVRDLARSVGFYQQLFGMPLQSDQVVGPRRVPVPCLTIGDGPQFIAFMEPTAFVPEDQLDEVDVSGRSGINHFCLGIAGFDPDGVVRTLEARDLRATRNMREGMRNDRISEIGTTDPDGLFVQIQDRGYCGGSGRLGDVCEEGFEHPVRASTQVVPPITVHAYRSVSLTVTDVPRAVEFYSRLFDVSTREARNGVTLLIVGSEGSYLALSRGTEPGISRFSLAVQRFDPDEAMLALADTGLSGRRVTSDGNAPAIAFTDPDGITVYLER